MSLLTNWGYRLTTVEALPDIIDSTEYNAYTSSRYSGDARIASNLSAVSSAIRNYCGWHVCPSLACSFETTFYDKRVTIVNGNIMIQLPATFVSGITSVTIGGVAYTSYVLETNGILRVLCNANSEFQPYSQIVIVYTAGLPSNLVNDIKELAAHRVTHALAASYGITSESSGGVSVTYNANWINNSRSTALADDNKEVLTPYRLKGVF